jgi:Fe-S cluster assembly protein SufD
MAETSNVHESRLSGLDGGRERSASSGTRRDDVLAQFLDRGIPTTREEEWKYTALGGLRKIPFGLPSVSTPARSMEIDAAIDRVGDGPAVVFRDGRFAPDLCRNLERLPREWSLRPLFADSPSDRPETTPGTGTVNLDGGNFDGVGLIGTALGDLSQNPFTSLNAALWEDGLHVHVGAGADPKATLRIVLLSGLEARPTTSHPRILISVAPTARATIIEDYESLGGELRFTNPVLEIVLDRDAGLQHYRSVRESSSTYHVSTVGARLARGSRLESVSLVFGGRIVRNDVHVRLEGRDSECTLDGLVIASGDQLVDNHTRIVHAEAHCRSWEVYKSILGGRATGVFNGKIFVEPIAQKTDAKQTNKSLLLSASATMNSKPELEIYADDVRCTHGATIGQLDEESLFYLRSRGLDLAEARNLLVRAFASEILDAIVPEDYRTRVEQALFAGLAAIGVKEESTP